jgi:hypothetical protein
MKRFRRLASRFSIGRGLKEYDADVVVSEEAIFVIVPSGILGAIGTLFTHAPLDLAIGAFGKAVAEAEDIIQAQLSDLPEEITEDPSWPVTFGSARVFILPRTTVKSMRYPWWGSLQIFTDEDRFNVIPLFLLRRRVLRNLRDLGWEV